VKQHWLLTRDKARTAFTRFYSVMYRRIGLNWLQCSVWCTCNDAVDRRSHRSAYVRTRNARMLICGRCAASGIGLRDCNDNTVLIFVGWSHGFSGGRAKYVLIDASWASLV